MNETSNNQLFISFNHYLRHHSQYKLNLPFFLNLYHNCDSYTTFGYLKIRKRTDMKVFQKKKMRYETIYIQSITTHLTIAILLFQIIQLASSVRAINQHDLYSDSDDVFRLNETNFASHVFHPNNSVAYMVEFYNTYCGHCQAFAPVYKQLATRVKNWTIVARVAGVDCAQDINVNLCTDNNILGYPTILFFPPRAHKDNPADKPIDYRSLQYDWTIDGLKESIIDNLYNLTQSHRPHHQALRALHHIDEANLNEVKQIFQDSESHDHIINEPQKRDFMIVIEKENSYLGRELILDYIRISDRLELRRMILNNTNLLKQILPKEDYHNLDEIQPILIRIEGKLSDKESKIQVLVRGEWKSTLPTSENFERLDAIYNRFKLFLEQYYSVELRHLQAVIGSDGSILRKPAIGADTNDIGKLSKASSVLHLIESGLIDKKKIFATDLLKSIIYIMTHEIPIKGDLKPFEFNIVRSLLTILKKYLPLDKWDGEVHLFIVDLRTRLDDKRDIYEKQNVKKQEFRDMIKLAGGDQLRLKYAKIDWISCAESDKNDKGYTCSLWLLFHTLTVGEFHKASPARVVPNLVLTTMRDYIINFFGCSVCSTNFKKETANLDSSLTSRNSSILWLWHTHNLVNWRLERERGSTRNILQVTFPNQINCPECYVMKLRDEQATDGLRITWSHSQVLEFFNEIYKSSKIISTSDIDKLYSTLMRKENINSKLEGQYIDHANGVYILPLTNNGDSVDQKTGIFSTIDISLCLFLWIASMIIVLFVCASLNPRWKRFKTM